MDEDIGYARKMSTATGWALGVVLAAGGIGLHRTTLYRRRVPQEQDIRPGSHNALADWEALPMGQIEVETAAGISAFRPDLH